MEAFLFSITSVQFWVSAGFIFNAFWGKAAGM
jgi:hypothetical protein